MPEPSGLSLVRNTSGQGKIFGPEPPQMAACKLELNADAVGKSGETVKPVT